MQQFPVRIENDLDKSVYQGGDRAEKHAVDPEEKHADYRHDDIERRLDNRLRQRLLEMAGIGRGVDHRLTHKSEQGRRNKEDRQPGIDKSCILDPGGIKTYKRRYHTKHRHLDREAQSAEIHFKAVHQSRVFLYIDAVGLAVYKVDRIQWDVEQFFHIGNDQLVNLVYRDYLQIFIKSVLKICCG